MTVSSKTGCANGIELSDYGATVIANERATDRLFIMELQVERLENPAKCKGELAACLQPGQFVHMTIPTIPNHILRRPFSVYATDPEHDRIEILYQVVGEGTAEMTRWETGQRMSLIGPIGIGWNVPDGTRRALLVGGGVGAAPLFMLCEQLVAQGVDVDVILGAATKDALVCMDRYHQTCGCPPSVSTDDGSFGRAGFCTLLVEEAVNSSLESAAHYDFAAVCGPEPLMRIASGMLVDAGIPCQVSMERRMACGVGACLSCVIDTMSGKQRACVDGPVFDAKEVIW